MPPPIAPPVEFSQSCGGAALVNGKKPRPKVTASSATIASSGNSAASVAATDSGVSCRAPAPAAAPGSGMAAPSARQLVASARQRLGRILLGARQHVDCRRPPESAWLGLLG